MGPDPRDGSENQSDQVRAMIYSRHIKAIVQPRAQRYDAFVRLGLLVRKHCSRLLARQ